MPQQLPTLCERLGGVYSMLFAPAWTLHFWEAWLFGFSSRCCRKKDFPRFGVFDPRIIKSLARLSHTLVVQIA